jgi:hypothetical protein
MAEAVCWADLTRRLGYATRGSNYRTVQRWAAKWGISSAYFDPNAGRTRAARARQKALAEVMVEQSPYSRAQLKQRLLAEGLKQPICELCGQGEKWRGRRMSLVLDHINGVSNDHRLENLRIVCPNCAATLDTHCGRNLPRERSCATCGEVFAPAHIRHRYCSTACSGLGRGELLRGVARPERRKVERPSYAQLQADRETLSMLTLGRKYGVCDNAVRKWLRAYERESGDGGATMA